MCGISHVEPSNQKDLTNVCQTFRLVSAARWSSTSVERTSVSATMLPPRQGKKTKVTNLPTKKSECTAAMTSFFYIDLLINRFREWVHYIYSTLHGFARESRRWVFKSSWNHPAIHFPKHQGPHGFKTTGLWGFAESWCCWSSQGWAKCWTNVGIWAGDVPFMEEILHHHAPPNMYETL